MLNALRLICFGMNERIETRESCKIVKSENNFPQQTVTLLLLIRYFLQIQFDEITICSLLKVPFNRYLQGYLDQQEVNCVQRTIDYEHRLCTLTYFGDVVKCKTGM